MLRFVSSALLWLLTLLTGLATAAVVLGPRELVVGGRGVAEAWLDVHPRIAEAVAALGGVEPAGNLLLFVPFACCLAAAVPRVLLLPALLGACFLPMLAETAQRWLPGRVPDGADVVRNTTGLLVAFLAVGLLRVAAALSRRMRRDRVRALRAA